MSENISIIESKESGLPINLFIKKLKDAPAISKEIEIYLCRTNTYCPIGELDKLTHEEPSLNTLKELEISKEDWKKIVEWRRINIVVLYEFYWQLISLDDFKNLMFKAGVYPSAKQRKTQIQFIRILEE